MIHFYLTRWDLRHSHIGKVLPNAIYNFDINIKGVKSSHAKQFLTMFRMYKIEPSHAGIESS